jgi:hypothetical protein
VITGENEELFYCYKCAGCGIYFKVGGIVAKPGCPKCCCITTAFMGNEIEQIVPTTQPDGG